MIQYGILKGRIPKANHNKKVHVLLFGRSLCQTENIKRTKAEPEFVVGDFPGVPLCRLCKKIADKEFSH
jgi:adenylate kinase family enzyme